MSAEENKALARSFYEAQAKGDLDAMKEMMAPDFVDHSLLPGQSPDREGYIQGVAEDQAAFSDIRIVIEDQAADGDKVISRFTIRGTHDRKDFMGAVPTGRKWEMTGIAIHRISGGKIVEEWSESGGPQILTQQRLEQEMRERELREQELSALQHNYGDVTGPGARRASAPCLSPNKEQAMPRTSPYHIELTDDERDRLQATARRYSSPHRDVARAKIVLLAAEGLPNDEIAARLDIPRQIVSKWRKRFYEQRLAGLLERPRSGRPPAFPPGGDRDDQGDGMRAARHQRRSALSLARPGSRPSGHRAGYSRLDLRYHHLAVALGRCYPPLAVS